MLREINLTHPPGPSRRTIASFAKNFLPLLTGTRTVIANLDNDVMEVPAAAF